MSWVKRCGVYAGVLFALPLTVACLWVDRRGAPPALSVAVMEYADHWTKESIGTGWLLERAGFTLKPLALDKPATAQGTEAIVFGSFASESPDYKRYMETHGKSLADFVRSGGVVVQFTQADQTEAAVPFLPDGFVVERCDEDLGDVWVRIDSHPLLRDWAGSGEEGARVVLPTHLGRPANWESLSAFRGCRVLLSSDEFNRRPVMIEAAYGKGRFVVTSLFLDKIYDASGQLAAPEPYVAAAAGFFAALYDYVELVNRGTAPGVTPTPPYIEPDPLPFVPGSFTLAVLPDTQVYCRLYPDHFYRQTDWIAKNARKYNIQYVLHLGDVTDHNTHEQWMVARNAMTRLDGVVPYAIAPGNHDFGDRGVTNNRETFLNFYFPVDRYRSRPAFGGVMEAGKLDNSYHTFEGNGQKFLILALEFGPRDKVVEWANQIVARHPDHRVILITHAYLYSDDTIYDWTKYGGEQKWNPHDYPSAKLPGGTNDGIDLWRKLVRKHPNFLLVVSGHVLNDGLGYRTTKGDHGNTVHQMLVNYQMKNEGGEGFLRLIEFLPDGETVQVKAYSPSTKTYKTDPQNQFVLKLKP